MRIRKSQVLFPSSFSTVPLSDPNLINRSPVVVQLNDATTTTHHASSAASQASTLDRYQPFDQTVLPPIGKPSNGCDDPSGIGETGEHNHHNKQQPLEESVVSGEKKGNSNSHFRKGHYLGLEIEAHDQVLLPPSNPSSTQDGRWCEGEKAIPLKKRRGSFENNNSNHQHHGNSSSKKMKAKMKTKMNKKCSTDQNDDDDVDWEEEVEEEEEEEGVRERKQDHHVNVGGKKRAKGSALMEGSRCSRVNGRGWRCCQQTLVGYSLCEHHLGKGRLRSMTSVRSRSIATSTTTTTTTAPPPPENNNKVHDNNISGDSSSSFPEKQIKFVSDNHDALVTEEKKPVVITKRRMKLGMVKARSISSLLGQTNTTTVAAHEDNNK